MLDALRVLFLVFLFITAIVFMIRKGPVLGFAEIRVILLDFILVPVALLTAAIFFMLIFRIDPMSILLKVSSQLSRQFNVSFLEAIPPELQDSMRVLSVSRHDTDNDDFSEWVVFYQFDLQSGRSPVQGVVYDNDRGNPPVIFPYQLRVPDRDYLSEDGVELKFAQIPASADNTPEEILIEGSRELSIFRFEENSDAWEPPLDDPPRYQVIGFFRGSEGVEFEDGRVTIRDRDEFERSQLVRRKIYEYQPNAESYFVSSDLSMLAPPVLETIDFFADAPDDVFDTAFPEKTVLAFYVSTCGSVDDSLCRSANADWNSRDFLLGPDDNSDGGEALREFNNRNSAYFGLTSLNNSQNIMVRKLRYYPHVERLSAKSEYTGAEPQGNCVEIQLGNPLPNQPDTLAFRMKLDKGQWKIEQQITPGDCSGEPQVLSDTFEPPSDTSEPAPADIPAANPTQIPSSE